MTSLPAVTIDSTPHDAGPMTVLAARHAPRELDDSLATAQALGRVFTAAPRRDLIDEWEALATLASVDVGAARTIEPHIDALSILRDARRTAFDGFEVTALLWGVFAAEGGDEPLVATPSGQTATLDGVKPWCSLAGRLDAALVTARVEGDDERSLFAVHLDEGVTVDDSAWVARGLTEIPSAPVRFTAVRAVPVGGPGWYLQRPGFAWGGVGVAACWYGGAVGIARAVLHAAAASRDPHALAHLGAVDELLHSARRAIAEAAELATLDDGAHRLTAKRVRATVARVCDEIIDRAHRVLGPAPLALDVEYTKRVADLQLYVRQHRAERDLASLGASLTDSERRPW
ncbi:MAG: acyl-CoA dehydrogenase [Microcella sp.]|uniref:acyl-CoA dehydrogenase n=1 Tax=Microcella sp. TaxID=1913979 RepID=UPI0024C73F41|nr:acyl-CoA dehydrogenase [Microcella sp.]UYN83148.1 MAG: acyl-CoA dehydrogenase [Microcella sp.]